MPAIGGQTAPPVGEIREAPQGLAEPRPTGRTVLVGHAWTATSFC
jgi:hypothetical protein